MATNYTTILKLALPTQGENSGTWGDLVNDNITSMIEEAIAGRKVINTWTTNSHTLTTADGTTSESRAAMLEFTDTGSALTGAGSVICPAQSKIYVAKNNTGSQAVTLKTSAGTGISIPDGETMLLFCDGTNVEQAVTNIASAKLGGEPVTLGGTLTTADAFTTSGAFSLTLTATAATNVTLPTTGTLSTLAGTETLTNKTLTSPAVGTAMTMNGRAELRFGDGDTSNYIGFEAPATVSSNQIWVLPDSDGDANQVIETDGSGNLSWTDQTGGIADVSADTTPQLGGNLDVNGNSIVSTSNGNILLTPNGTGAIRCGNSSYTPSDINDLATKKYVDNRYYASTSSTTQTNLVNLGALADGDCYKVRGKATKTGVVHAFEAMVIYNGTTIDFTIYNIIHSGTELFSQMNFVNNGGNLNIQVTSTSSDTTGYTFKVVELT